MGSGHALDAIKRLQFNRTLKLQHRNRYNKMKEAVSKINAQYHNFNDRSQLTKKELKFLKSKIK